MDTETSRGREFLPAAHAAIASGSAHQPWIGQSQLPDPAGPKRVRYL